MHFNAQGPGAECSARESVERLMAEHGNYVLRLCRAIMSDTHLAEDAWQETWIKVWKAYPKFRHDCSEKTWIARIAINTCRDMRRSAWFRLFSRSIGDEPLMRIPAAEAGSTGRVTEAIGKLSPKYREVLTLFYLEEMSLAEIAEITNVGINTVSTRLRRGRMQLRKLLEGGNEYE